MLRLITGLIALTMTLFALLATFGWQGLLVWLALNIVLGLDRYEAHLKRKTETQHLNGDWWRNTP